MDEKDIRILSAVAEHKTASSERLHEITDIPKSTIHYRLNEMKDEGIIEDDLLNINLEEVGLSMTLVSQVWASYDEGYHESVGDKIAEIEGVNQVYFVLGDTDFIAISHIPDRERVERLVSEFEAIDEITRTSSTFAIKRVKDEPAPMNDYETDTLIGALSSE